MTDKTPTSYETLGRVVQRLANDYDTCFNRDEVAATLHDSYDRLSRTARVTSFLPVLVERLTRERLDALAQSQGKIAKRAPEVLFVCVHNAGRSQMAAALSRHYAGRQLHIRTGGSNPDEQIHPNVVHAIKELGLSLDEEFPKPLTDEVLAAADVVVTMGCGDECPVVPGRLYQDWPIPDPASVDLDGVREIRQDVDLRVRSLLATLLPELSVTPLT